jgi:hypothetical protein
MELCGPKSKSHAKYGFHLTNTSPNLGIIRPSTPTPQADMSMPLFVRNGKIVTTAIEGYASGTGGREQGHADDGLHRSPASTRDGVASRSYLMSFSGVVEIEKLLRGGTVGCCFAS